MSIWQLGSKINGNTVNNRFGRSSTMNSQGNIFAVGTNLSDSGYVKVYRYSENIITQLGSTLQGGADELFGVGCALNGDGTKLICCANGDSGRYAKVYEYTGGDWIQHGNIINVDENNFGFEITWKN